MKPGTDTWKWILVVILLGAFVVTANQAYVHVSSQEDYAPPDDYLKGDSWDVEHKSGPGAGQPMQMSEQDSAADEAQNLTREGIADQDTSQPKKQLEHEEEIDWNSVEDPSLE